jgi:hypothetical protein
VASVNAADPNPCTAISVPFTEIVPFVLPVVISAAYNALSAKLREAYTSLSNLFFAILPTFKLPLI